MKVEIKKTVSIKNADNWKDYAPPKDAKTQWKDGRSAKELARFVTSEEFIPFLRAFLKDLGIKNQDFEAEPEAETYFPEKEFGKSGPRNHDLLMNDAGLDTVSVSARIRCVLGGGV